MRRGEWVLVGTASLLVGSEELASLLVSISRVLYRDV